MTSSLLFLEASLAAYLFNLSFFGDFLASLIDLAASYHRIVRFFGLGLTFRRRAEFSEPDGVWEDYFLRLTSVIALFGKLSFMFCGFGTGVDLSYSMISPLSRFFLLFTVDLNDLTVYFGIYLASGGADKRLLKRISNSESLVTGGLVAGYLLLAIIYSIGLLETVCVLFSIR